MNEKLLTPEQVAERLQVTERTVYGWLRRGKLPALKLGRLWRIRPQDLEAFLESARARAGLASAPAACRDAAIHRRSALSLAASPPPALVLVVSRSWP